jgi:DNA-binding phage protein
MRKYRTWHEVLMEDLADPVEAISYLDVSLEEYQMDGDIPFFLKGLRNVVEAQGGVASIAKRTAMAPETLSKILSSEKAPHLDTLAAVLKALGCRLAIVPLKADEPATADTVPVAEVESKTVGGSQTQLIESDSPQ